MLLEKQFILYTFRAFALLAGIFFPILYLADFLFSEGFQPLYALIKLPFRYGQSLASLLLWSVWMAVRRLRKRYSDVSFITMGFRPKDGWRVVVILSVLFAALDAFVIIPSNDWFFSRKVISTNWSIYSEKNNQNKNADSFFLHKIGDNVELWQTKPYSNFSTGSLNNNIAYIKKIGKNGQEIDMKLKLNDNDFFILWNEPKKLSWSGIKKCRNYLKNHNLSTIDLDIQFQIFLSRVLLLIPMVLFGFALGWRNGVNAMVACCIFSNWLNQIVVFMPLSWAGLCVWLDVVLWSIIGIWYLR